MLERAQEHTRLGKFTNLEYARFADDLVILINAHPRHSWVLNAVAKRLREELVKLDVQINEEKSRTVDLARGESFGFPSECPDRLQDCASLGCRLIVIMNC